MLEWRDAFFLFQAKKAKTCRSCPQLTSGHFPTASHVFWAIERKFNFWISLKMYVYLCPFRSYLTHFTLGHRPWVLLGKLTDKYLKSINTLVIGSSLEQICIVLWYQWLRWSSGQELDWQKTCWRFNTWADLHCLSHHASKSDKRFGLWPSETQSIYK